MRQVQTESGMLQRKKIWEIEPCYKCALIGLCLNHADLKKLSRERIYDLDAGMEEYRLHSCFIHIADQENEKGRSLHKYLEKKFKANTKKYLLATSDQELLQLWQEDLAKGEVAAAWWGIISHPLISADLTAQLYGIVHMFSHQAARNWHASRLQASENKSKMHMLKEVMASDRQQYRREKKQWQKELAALRQALSEQASQQKELPHLRQNSLAKTRQEAPARQAQSRKTNEQALLTSLQEELAENKRLLAIAEERLAQQEQLLQENQRLQDHLNGEIALLESLFRQHEGNSSLCHNCADHNTEKCPGMDLCGKTVLYVGGLHKMVPHYRQLVEQYGGRFIHHDGGREASRNLLPKMLISADAVLCPIDCISHDACTQVKKMCKRYQKPFVPMRSSGLSSLAKGLSGILQ